MRLTHFSATVAVMACLTVTPVYAAQRGHTGGRGASPHATSPHPQSPHATPRDHEPSATHGPSGTTGTTATTQASPLVQRIQSKPQLRSRIDTLLKGTGMTLSQAAAGFSNQGQFIAALHVAQNHPAIKFADLRHEMVDNHRSLGEAVQTLTKSVDASKATLEAERQAEVDMTASSPTTPAARKAKK